MNNTTDLRQKNQRWKFGWVKKGTSTNWQYGTAEEAQKYYENGGDGTWFCLPVEEKSNLKSWGVI